MKLFKLSKSRANRKTGSEVYTTYSKRETCPKSCALMGNGCYAERFPTRWQWNFPNYQDLKTFTSQLRALPARSKLRLNVAGDLPQSNKALEAIANSTRHLIAWTYTHKTWRYKSLERIKGITFNLSCDSLKQARNMQTKTSLPIVAVIPKGLPKVISGCVRCPAQTSKRLRPDGTKESRITCSNCGNGNPICFRKDRKYIVLFEKQ